MTHDPILDDLFHGVIWAAFVIEARAAGTWPDPEKVRKRAYALYEAEKRKQSGCPNIQVDQPAYTEEV